MATDTTLFDIYTDLGVSEIMEYQDIATFVDDECVNLFQGEQTVAA